MVEEIRDDLEHGFLDPVFAAVCSAGDEVALTRDAAFLQGLVEQVGLTRGDDGVGGAVHQEHRGARLADVVDGVGRLGCLLVGEDASVTAAEDRRAVDPEGFCRASRAVLCLDFFGEVGANLREVREPVEVDSGLNIARDLEISPLSNVFVPLVVPAMAVR